MWLSSSQRLVLTLSNSRTAFQQLINAKRILVSCTGIFKRCSTTSSSEERRLPTSQADRMTDIGTRDIFNSNHDILRASVRKFFNEEVKPFVKEFEKIGQASRECWLSAGKHGILGVDVPQEYGGVGGTYLDAAIILEEQSYTQFVVPGFSLHSNVALPYIYHYGTSDQVAKYVPDMIAGRKIGAIAMTEPGAGSDLQGIRTTATRDGDDWILNGSKTYITNGVLCDVVIVVAVTKPDVKSRAHGISLFLVDADTPGFVKGKNLEKLGLKASDMAELFFDNVRLPSSAVLGEVNQGFYHLMKDIPRERLAIGVLSMARCEGIFEDTKEFVMNRKAFGKPLSRMQVIQHKLAELKTKICVGRAFTDQCILLQSRGELDSCTASMNKYWVTDLVNQVAGECLQLHGGAGFMLEYPISQAYADVRALTILAGTNEIMKEIIGRSITV